MTVPVSTPNEIDDLEIDGFYLPLEDLTIRIANRIEALEYEAMENLIIKEESDEPDPESNDNIRQVPNPSSDSGKEILLQQRLLAEELDSCLADSAESDEAANGEKINIQKTIVDGMSDALGLEVDDELLVELSNGFQDWIDNRGSFTAGWGEIISTNDGNMYLHAFDPADDVATEPTFSRVYPFPQR